MNKEIYNCNAFPKGYRDRHIRGIDDDLYYELLNYCIDNELTVGQAINELLSKKFRTKKDLVVIKDTKKRKGMSSLYIKRLFPKSKDIEPWCDKND